MWQQLRGEVNLNSISTCPICGSIHTNRIGEKNKIPIISCLICTHMFADLEGYEFNHENLEDFREGFTHGLMSTDAHYYEHLTAGEAKGFPTNITATKVLSIVQGAGFSKVSWLDIGAGSGHLVKRAQELGFDVTGIEPGGWGQIAVMRKEVRIMQRFLEKNREDKKYSIVTATDVVEHVANPVEFLALMSGYLTELGMIVISVPCIESIEAKVFGMRWPMIAPPTHRHFFTRRSLSTAISKAGMRPKIMLQFNIRRYYGLSRYSAFMDLIDKLINGDQLVCAMTLGVD